MPVLAQDPVVVIATVGAKGTDAIRFSRPGKVCFGGMTPNLVPLGLHLGQDRKGGGGAPPLRSWRSPSACGPHTARCGPGR